MISQTIIYYAAGTAPFTYSVTDTNQLSCATIAPANGTSEDGYITFIVSANTGDCFDEIALSLVVVDSEGCTQTTSVDTPNPCENFTVSAISVQNLYSFSVVASGGVAPYTYEWNWDNNVFHLENPQANTNNNFIDLSLSATPPPATSTISVKVTDSKKCNTLITYNYVFCRPEALDTSVTLVCDKKDGISINDNVFLEVLSCLSIDEITIDWNTLTFSTPYGIHVEHPYSTNPFAVPNQIKITTNVALVAGLYEVAYTVADTSGIVSTTGTIHVTSPQCVIPMNVYVPDQVVQIPCGTIAGDIIEIEVCNRAVPADQVDWETFRFLSSGTTIATSPLGVVESYPDNLEFSLRNCLLYYTVPAVTGSDIFQWQVNSYSGNVSNAAITAVYLDCPEAVTAVDDEECGVCGEPVIIDVLGNDTEGTGAGLFPQSLQIITGPANGTAFINTDWRIVYTPNATFQGTDTITYKVGNNAVPVVYSNTGTVTIDVVCAGEAATVTVC